MHSLLISLLLIASCFPTQPNPNLSSSGCQANADCIESNICIDVQYFQDGEKPGTCILNSNIEYVNNHPIDADHSAEKGSRKNPYQTIQEAINAAVSSEKSYISLAGSPQMYSAAVLGGKFVGYIPPLAIIGPWADPKLSGKGSAWDAPGPVATIQPGAESPSINVEGAHLILDGVNIIGANGATPPVKTITKGAVECQASPAGGCSILIRRVVISKHPMSGIYVHPNSPTYNYITIYRSVIVENDGYGIELNAPSRLLAINNLFLHNSLGGIKIVDQAEKSISGTFIFDDFISNGLMSSNLHGGIECAPNSQVDLLAVVFHDNLTKKDMAGVAHQQNCVSSIRTDVKESTSSSGPSFLGGSGSMVTKYQLTTSAQQYVDTTVVNSLDIESTIDIFGTMRPQPYPCGQMDIGMHELRHTTTCP